MTFNHGVEGSSPSALTNENSYLKANSAFQRYCETGPCTQPVHSLGAFDDIDTLGLVVLSLVVANFFAIALSRRRKS